MSSALDSTIKPDCVRNGSGKRLANRVSNVAVNGRKTSAKSDRHYEHAF